MVRDPSQRNTILLVLTVVASVLLSYLVSRPGGGAGDSSPMVGPDAVGPTTEVDDRIERLQRQLDDLAMTVATLQDAGSGGRRTDASSRVPSGVDPDVWESMMTGDARAREAFRREVEAVLDDLVERRESIERGQELTARQEDAVEANAEYDLLDTELADRMLDIEQELGLSADQSRDLQSLIATQNDRNRQLTNQWASGDVEEEDLGRLFQEHRAAHRNEILSLLDEDQLWKYREYLSNGGLGGRFAFFVGSGEVWAADASQDD